jgi:hypothetical protein
MPELAGREVFCLGCGKHFVIPIIQPSHKQADHAGAFQTVVIDLTATGDAKDISDPE